jgi:hypothetical protein
MDTPDPPYRGQHAIAASGAASAGEDMRKHRNPPALPPDGTSAQSRARLWRFALASRDDATRVSGTATIPIPGHGSVLAGPLQRSPRLHREEISGQPEASATADGRREKAVHPEQHRVAGF